LEQIELRHFRNDLTGEIDIVVVPADSLSCPPQSRLNDSGDRLEGRGRLRRLVGHPKRFQELFAKGVRRANETKRVGFAQVYRIFIAIDTRARNNGWYTYDD
jgi:hypothetical protein